MSRQFGDSGADPLSRAFSGTMAVFRGTVVADRLVDSRWAHDVLPDLSTIVFPMCEWLRQSPRDSNPVVGSRVLVGVLGDGQGVILGVFTQGDTAFSETDLKEDDSDVKRSKQFGPGDRVIEHAGSRIVMTADGDIILMPKRDLRIEAKALVRLSAGGDAGDKPLSTGAFLAWAEKVEDTLSAHEQWILTPGTQSTTHSHPTMFPNTVPRSDENMGADGLRVPSAPSDSPGGE